MLRLLGESVVGEEWRPSRNNKCPIIQPKIIIASTTVCYNNNAKSGWLVGAQAAVARP
jgi:hypothetical protein